VKPVLTTVKNIFVLLLLTTSAIASDFSPEVVREAWKRRAEKLAGFDITFETSHVETVTEDMLEDSELELSINELPETIAYQTTSRILADGRMIRYELQGLRPDINMQLRKSNFVCSYDMSRSCILNEPTTDFSYTTGIIHNEEHCSTALPLRNAPIVFVTSLYTLAEFGIDLDKMILQPNEATINGTSCIVLSQTGENGFPSSELWLDPKAGFSIRRLRFLNGTTCVNQIDCSYKKEAEFLVPQEWTTTRFLPDGGLLTSSKSTVVKMLVNQDFTTDDFSITFPAGTVVSDARNSETAGRTGTHDYIVLENGKKRVITWEDRNTPYEELLRTKPEIKNIKQPNNFLSVMVAANLLVVITLVVYLFARRRMLAKSNLYQENSDEKNL